MAEKDVAHNEREETPSHDLAQIMGVIVVLTGLGLVIATSLGVANFNNATLRLFFIFGGLFLAGKEALRAAVRVIVERFA